MPLAAAIIPAVIGAGASIYGASQANKATGRAVRAQEAAAQQQLAAQQANFDRISGLNQPFVDAGRGGIDALMREFGIGSRAPSQPSAGPRAYDAAGNVVASPQGAPAMGGGGQGKAPGGFAGTSPMEAAQPGRMDAQAYWDANPDLAADQSLAGFNPGDLTGDGTVDNADRGQWHYQNYGQNEGRNAPMQAQGVTQPEAPQTGFDPTRPMAAAPPEFAPRQDVAMGDFGRAPTSGDYLDPSKFRTDPGYAFRVSEALNGVNAASAARGKLRSGDAAKALLERSNNLADQSYNNWFNQGMQRFSADRGAYENDRGDARSVWQAQQGRADTNYGNDRAYGTSMWEYGTNRGDRTFDNDRDYGARRGDVRTDNLFRLANVGLQGAGNVSGAGTNLANRQGDIYGNQADARSGAAFARAGANTTMVQGLGNAASNLFSSWGGGQASPVTPGMMQKPWNPQLTNRPSDIPKMPWGPF